MRTPYSRSAAADFSPTPHSRRISSGARNAASSPGSTTTSPSGFWRSEAILATSFVVATPTEIVRSTDDVTSSLIRRPIAAPSPNRTREPVTSRKASSIEIGSTSGVNRRRTAITALLASVYFAPSTGTKIPVGHRRPASRSDIAEWTPNARAS